MAEGEKVKMEVDEITDQACEILTSTFYVGTINNMQKSVVKELVLRLLSKGAAVQRKADYMRFKTKGHEHAANTLWENPPIRMDGFADLEVVE